MNYAAKLNKATALIAELEIDDGMAILFEILEENPKDIDLIKRIYSFAIKQPSAFQFKDICFHLFALESQNAELLVLRQTAFNDYLAAQLSIQNFSKGILFNLLVSLDLKRHEKQLTILKNNIITNYAEDIETPAVLKRYCEKLIENKQIIKARDEINYLINYYIETSEGQWAITQKLNIDSNIKA